MLLAAETGGNVFASLGDGSAAMGGLIAVVLIVLFLIAYLRPHRCRNCGRCRSCGRRG